MISKSFLDLLFILLCATIVMLSDSVRLGSLAVDPVRADASSVMPVDWTRAVLVRVSDTDLRTRDQRFSPAELVRHLRDEPETDETGRSSVPAALLAPADNRVPHARVMAVLVELRRLGIRTELAVRPDPPATEPS